MTSRMISNSSRQISRSVEALESRALLAAELVSGVLTVTGDDGNEHIEVDINEDGTNIEVNIERIGGSGGDDLEPTEIFNAGQVSRIVILAEGGTDDVAVDTDLMLPAEIRGGDGDDTLTGGSGADYIYGGGGQDRLFGREGNDTLSGGSSRNWMYGAEGDDLLNGSSGRDFLRGEAGNDRLYGGNGDDDLDGGGNVDRLRGGNGADVLFGGTAIDRLYGDSGEDTLFGGAAADYLYGGVDEDSGQREGADSLDSIELEI